MRINPEGIEGIKINTLVFAIIISCIIICNFTITINIKLIAIYFTIISIAICILKNIIF